MNFSNMLFVALASTALFACKTDEIKDDLGNVTIGGNSFHVEQEGAWAPGTSTNYAIKANPGTPKPDAVSCYYGAPSSTAETSTSPVVDAVYDPGDDDFDCTYLTPSTINAGEARLYIQVTYNGILASGSTTVDQQAQ
jgi:hypothetical protein